MGLNLLDLPLEILYSLCHNYDQTKFTIFCKYTCLLKFNIHLNKHGLWSKKYKNGDLKLTCLFNNGKFDGKYVKYHRNRNVHVKCNYQQGKLHGNYKEFDKSSTMLYDCNWKYGKKHGSWKQWDYDGEKFVIFNYENGRFISFGHF